MKLQKLLDAYGASCQCKNWEGWVRECMQHPEMVVNKFNEIIEEFGEYRRYGNIPQISQATRELKDMCYDESNWCRNQAHYMVLFGDNKVTNEWFEGYSEK